VAKTDQQMKSDGESRRATRITPRTSLNPRDVRAAIRAGAMDGKRNIPDAESLTPWPTPVMLGLLAESQATLHVIEAECHEALAAPRIRLAVLTHRADQARKRYGSPSPTGSGEDDLARELANAERAQAAAEVRLSTVQNVYGERRDAVIAAAQERLATYWGANLAARRDDARLLLAELRLPDANHQDGDGDE
jgi:hypothetical protein